MNDRPLGGMALATWLLSACTLALLGCSEFQSQSLGAPCITDGECPAGAVCNHDINRCVDDRDALLADAVSDVDEPTCDCAPLEDCCDGLCLNVADNDKHCGACGRACADGEVCRSGRCVCDAPEGFQDRACDVLGGESCCTGSGCLSLSDTTQSCGACGLRCNPGEVCQSALCNCGGGLACPTDTVCCGGVCCGTNELCCDGQCLPPDDVACQCGSGGACGAAELCCSNAGEEACADPDVSEDHCGICGQSCGAQQRCSLGACECIEGFGDCDGDLANGCEADLASNDESCGACGATCGAGTVCSAGLCLCGASQSECLPGQTCCASGCVDLDDDEANCGQCDRACPAAAQGVASVHCVSGVCEPTCEPDWGDCDEDPANGCETETGSNPAACGGCAPCGPNESCAAGICTCPSGNCACTAGERFCDGSCVDVGSSIEHCGACAKNCAAGEVCVGGTCACPSDLSKCGGTCLDVTNDVSNCGACGADCQAAPQVSSATCAGGQCALTCAVGYADCSSAAGCETPLGSNTHCAACGDACTGGKVCSNGACVCPSGQSDCGGDCVNTDSDAGNCGGCGMTCGALPCISGTCCSTAPTCTNPRSCAPLDGTFVVPNNMAEGDIAPWMAEIAALGMDTVIIVHSRRKSPGSGCGTYAYQWEAGFPAKLGTFLNAAATHNIQVYVGLSISTNECGSWWAEPNRTQTTQETGDAIRAVLASYGSHSALSGWYIPDEPWLSVWSPGEIQTTYGPYYRDVVNTIRAEDSRPVLYSPSLGSVHATGFTPAQVASSMNTFKAETGVDVAVLQDSVGQTNIDLGYGSGRATLRDYYFAIQNAVGIPSLWGNAELFNCCVNITGEQGGAGRGSSVTRLDQQDAATYWTNGTHMVSRMVSWYQPHYASAFPPAWAGADSAADARRFLAGYQARHGLSGNEWITPASYQWRTTPGTSYPDGGNELFDGVTADPVVFGNAAWVGVDGTAEVEVSFGRIRGVDWVSAHVLNLNAPSIRFPDRMVIECSTDGTSFAEIGRRELGLNGAPSRDDSDWVMGNLAPLDAACSHLRVRFDNSAWTFVSELELVDEIPMCP